ncbi:MAG TPA: WecB/TagA/CpsF family glycosyltransferase [Candidatus Saccharimonadales bacterium]|nr:WecB/TagA/CpsF family glycosyltransferase [Candidatus Saccharimonadales bacterium]
MPITSASYKVLDTRIDALDNATGLARAQDLASDQAAAHYIVLPYVEFLNQAAQDRELQNLLNQADLSLANGVSINWAIEYLYGGETKFSRFLATLTNIITRPANVHRLAPSRFDSSNFTWPMLEWAAREHRKVVLIGSPKQQSIEGTAKFIQTAIPGAIIAGVYPGYFHKAGRVRLIQELRQLEPDLILVGIGFPKQEALMHDLRNELSHGLMIGEGGSFDYELFGGSIKRAPNFIRTIGLEWLWRLIREPARLHRQLAIPAYLWRVWRQGRHLPE